MPNEVTVHVVAVLCLKTCCFCIVGKFVSKNWMQQHLQQCTTMVHGAMSVFAWFKMFLIVDPNCALKFYVEN